MNDKRKFASATSIMAGAIAAALGEHATRAFLAERIRRETQAIANEIGNDAPVAENIARLNALADEIEGGQFSTQIFRRSLSESVSRRASVKEAAHKFNVSERTVQRIAPAIGQKIGGRWEIDVRKMAERLSPNCDVRSEDERSNKGDTDV